MTGGFVQLLAEKAEKLIRFFEAYATQAVRLSDRRSASAGTNAAELEKDDIDHVGVNKYLEGAMVIM